MEALRERADITQFAPFVDYNKIGEVLDYTINGLMMKSIKSGSFRYDLFLQEAEEYVNMIKAMSLME